VVDLLPDATLVEVPGAGHTLNYSAPGELAEIVQTLLPRERTPCACMVASPSDSLGDQPRRHPRQFGR
jgi:hypothetical protein